MSKNLGLALDISSRPVWQVPPVPANPPRFALRVELPGAQPPVWRSVEMAGKLTMDVVHEALQACMGWTDSHLHRFVQDPDNPYGSAYLLTSYDVDEGEEGTLEEETTLAQVVSAVGDQIGYEYDFGDSWTHVLTVTAVNSPDEDKPPVECLDGENACPLEDVGGIPSHNELVAWLEGQPGAEVDDPETMREWVPDHYDPRAFDLAEIHAQIAITLVKRVIAELPMTPLLRTMGERFGGLHPTLNLLLIQAFMTSERQEIAAGHDAIADLTDAEVEQVVKPWQFLLNQIPAKGLKLTAAGYLPPAVVAATRQALQPTVRWIGAGNRENQIMPVLWLRESAQQFGLIRKTKGYLFITANGKRCQVNPRELLRHILSKLPLGDTRAGLEAGMLELLQIAAGADNTSPEARQVFVELYHNLGWQTDRDDADHTLLQRAMNYEARPTRFVMRSLGMRTDMDSDHSGDDDSVAMQEKLSRLAAMALLEPDLAWQDRAELNS